MPVKDFTIGGFCGTGEYRLRPSWFGCILEELTEDIHGNKYWKRVIFPLRFQVGDIKQTELPMTLYGRQIRSVSMKVSW